MWFLQALPSARKVVLYGFREYNTLEMALDHTLGALPEPQTTHKFR